MTLQTTQYPGFFKSASGAGDGVGDLDSQVSALLGDTTSEMDVARKNRVFCNRNLRMDKIEMIKKYLHF